MAAHIHAVPGRLRVKIPLVKERAEEALRIEDLFRGQDGIERVSVNGVTGSIVFRYDPLRTESGDILNVLARHGFIHSDEQTLQPASPRGPLSRPGELVGKALFGWVVEKALEPTGLSILAALI